MNKKLTELVFILDKSGSMAGLEEDTIGGFNAMLRKQQEEEGQARVTTVLFDNRYELLHDRLDLPSVAPITGKDYLVGGSTALLDAIGRTVSKVDAVLAKSKGEFRADRVLFVIITDGMENASRHFSRETVANLVTARREMGWEFLFLGANMDAIAVAQSYGIAQDRAQTFLPDTLGMELNFLAMNSAAREFRQKGRISPDWDEQIRKRSRK